MTRTTNTTSTSAATWSGDAAELRRLARAVLAHAPAKASDAPVLNHVQFEIRDRSLILTASDRFTLGMIRTDLTDHTGPAFDLLISAAALKSAIATIGRRGPIDLGIDPAGITLTFHHPHADDATAAVSYRLPASTITTRLPWHKALLGALRAAATPSAATVTTTAVNPAYLARFQLAADRGESLVIHAGAGPRKTVVLTAGEDFIGMVSPVLTDPDIAAGRLTTWTDLLDGMPAAAPARAAA